MRGVIDRIEDGRIAVIILDDGQELRWPAALLPTGAREGAAIVLTLSVDEADTERRLKHSQELLDDIFDQEES